MDRESVKTVLRDVFGANFPMRDVGQWVSIQCVLSPWTHAGGHDKNPSAGVSVDPNGSSIFSCFSCKNAGPLHSMLRKYAKFTGEDLGDLIEELEEDEYFGPRDVPDWDTLKNGTAKVPQMPLDEGVWMDLYDSAAGHPYLLGRGVSKATAKKLELLYDPRDPEDGQPRILFPVRGYDGLLYGFSGRATRADAKLKVRDYHGLAKAQNVLGAHLVAQDDPGEVLLVEGLVDYAMAHECGYHGCAVMHSTLTAAQAAIVRGFSKPVYLFYDNPLIDKAGAAGVEIAGRLLYQYVPTMRVRYPDIEIEDDSDAGFHIVKDVGDLLAGEIADMIADCRLFEP